MRRWGRWVIIGAVLFALSATAFAQMRPRKFCGCPDHPQPQTAAAVGTSGTRYRLHAYNDAFRPSPVDPWCYTRAVWFDAVVGSGRFEWRASDEREVLTGAIAQDADLCDTQSAHQSPTGPVEQASTIQHGPMLGSSTNIGLYSVPGGEVAPTLSEKLRRLFSALTGFATLPANTSPTRITVRVISTVVGNAPPYTLEYQIDSPSKHSLELREFGRRPAAAERSVRLYWEAAISREFYDELEHNGFVDGGAPVKIQLKSVPGVVAGVGRLLILPPGVPPPATDAPAKDVLLLGTASAFRVAPSGQPAPPGPVRIQ